MTSNIYSEFEDLLYYLRICYILFCILMMIFFNYNIYEFLITLYILYPNFLDYLG